MSLPVIVPVNRLGRAKGRLAPVLTEGERTELSLLTLETVVEAASGAGLDVTLLTPEPEVMIHVRAWAALVRGESSALAGLNAQLEAAVAGSEEALILHADLPLATADAVAAVVAQAPGPPSVTLVESADGGTNAMLLRPPGRFRLAYGRASCEKHVRSSEAAGMTVRLVDSPGLRLDLDTAADLARLVASDLGRASRAGRYLLAIRVEERLREALR